MIEMAATRPRVAVVSPSVIVAAGVAQLLGHHPEIEVVETALDPDVVVFDFLALLDANQGVLDALDRHLTRLECVVLVLSHDLRPELTATALARGAADEVSIRAGEAALLSAVLAAGARSAAAQAGHPGSSRRRLRDVRELLSEEAGLSLREVDVLIRVTQGLSNQEIAQDMFVSINTVKTYIRTAYRRIGVGSRTQAVLWYIKHGFADRNAREPSATLTTSNGSR